MKKSFYFIGFVFVLFVFQSLANVYSLNNSYNRPTQQLLQLKNIPIYSYKIIDTFPHNTQNFTEGFYFSQDLLYESSGLLGRSTLQMRTLNSITPLKEYRLPNQYFAEGITIMGNNLYQLTYKSKIGFVYDKNSLQLIKTFHYNTEGWGLTNDGKNLMMSDGSATLTFMNPNTFHITKKITVHASKQNIMRINELEYIHGKIYANIWGADVIAIISPDDGALLGLINLSGINPNPAKLKGEFVLNGIAYNKKNNSLLVTGKCWPSIFEIKIKDRRYSVVPEDMSST